MTMKNKEPEYQGSIDWINKNKYSEYTRLGYSFKKGDLVDIGFYHTDNPIKDNYTFAYLYMWRLDEDDKWNKSLFLFDTTPKKDEYFTDYKEDHDNILFNTIEEKWNRLNLKK